MLFTKNSILLTDKYNKRKSVPGADASSARKMADAGIAVNEIVLASDECFVLGDNRNNSEDSRSANIGPIKNKDIIGKAWFHMNSEVEGIGFVN